MLQRKSSLLILYFGFSVLILILIFTHMVIQQTLDEPLLMAKRRLAAQLELTDLCIFTEARYTRNVAVADYSTPFQDYPMSFEHFPSGSLVTPPNHLKKHGHN
jgi:hypothetical protein